MTQSSHVPDTKQEIVSQFMADKLLLRLDRHPSGAPTAMAAQWRAKQALQKYLSALPVPLLRLLHSCEGGYAVLWHGDSSYHPGAWQGVQAVAFLNLAELESRPETALSPFGQLVDHLLGSLCREPAAYLSEGASVSPHWSAFHGRLLAAKRLNYASNERATESPVAYFRWAFAQYCADRQKLSTVDPQAYRLLHSTVFSESYWHGHPLSSSTSAEE